VSKLLLLFLVVLIFFWLLRRALGGRKPKSGTPPEGSAAQGAPELVACAHCGVLLPQNEAISSTDADPPAVGRFFCTREHLRLGPR
jgi:uncharacterized protein